MAAAVLVAALAGASSARAEVAMTGTDFWACDFQTYYGIPPFAEPFGLVVANPQSFDVTVSVEGASGPLASAVVSAGGQHAFSFDRTRLLRGTELAPKGYHVTASAPVRVQQVSPLTATQTHSFDVSTLLPVEALGTVYRPLSREGYLDLVLFCDDLPGSIAVVGVAVEPTSVVIVPNAPVRAGSLPATPAGAPIAVTLARFDVLNLDTDVGHGIDFTGSLIVSDRPIAVFGGSPISFVPSTEVAGEHLEEQCFPVSTWGREYVLAKSKQRTTEPDLWRVVAAEDDTRVTLTPALLPPFVLRAGEYFEFATTADVHLLATAPVEVGQYLVGGGRTPGVMPGDPSMIVAIPVEQFTHDCLVLTPDTPVTHPEDYVTIVKRTTTAVDLDGSPVAAGAFVAIGATGWERAWLPVSDGLHHVVASEPVGVSYYGYGPYAAYGTHAGAGTQPINTAITCDAAPASVGCVGGSIALDGTASAGPGPLEFLWSAITPGVTIATPDAASSAATVSGGGPWTVALTVTSGEDANTCFVTVPVAQPDVTAPIASCLALVTSATTTPGSAIVPVLASAVDECDDAPSVVNDRTQGGPDASGPYPCGETLVTFTATDSTGNEDSCVTRVIVMDASVPPGLSETDGRRLRVRRDPVDPGLLEVTFEVPASPAEVVNFYVGTLLPTGIVAYDHQPFACHAFPSLVRPGVAMIPAPFDAGSSHYYLVSASNCLGEGTRGSRSDGVPRPALPTDCGAVP